MTISSNETDALLVQLEETDDSLRALYRMLAEDPDLAEQREGELQNLRAMRRSLAERVGLTVLQQRRATRVAPLAASSAIDSETSIHTLAGAPASSDVVDEWKRSAGTTGFGRVDYDDHFEITWEVRLEKLLTVLGPPRGLVADVHDELDALGAVAQTPSIEEWTTLPRDVQQVWLALLVARTRAVKDVMLSPSQVACTRTIISRYPRWAAKHQPGHVNGLKVEHEPKHRTWAEDSQQLWATLEARLAQQRLVARKTTARKRPSEKSASDDDVVRAIDSTWPLWSEVRGRRAVIVGGDPREPNRERLERQFEFGSLEWPEIDGPRKVSALVSRIKGGSLDLVVVLRGFVDHTQSEPIVAAAKEASVAWALADGYGTTSVKLGLERFLAHGLRVHP